MSDISDKISFISCIIPEFADILTVEEIKYGNPAIRNNQLAMFASRTMPYSGLGSGIRRAYAEQPDMELVNDIEGEQFIVRFPRVC